LNRQANIEDHLFDQFLLGDLIASGPNTKATVLINSIYEGFALLPTLLLGCKMNRSFGLDWMVTFGSADLHYTSSTFVRVWLGFISIAYVTRSFAVGNLLDRFYKPLMFEHSKAIWVAIIVGMPATMVIIMYSYYVGLPYVLFPF